NGLLYWTDNTRVFNPYATQACYFLTEADVPGRMETVTAELTPVKTYQSFTDHTLYEKDEFAWFHSGRNLYENVNYATTNSHTYTLSAPGSMNEKESLTIAFTAGAPTSTQVTPTVNGRTLPVVTLSSTSKYIYGTQSVRTTDVSSYRSGNAWTVKLTSTKGNDARLDYLALHYTRALKPHEGYVAFSGTAAHPAQFDVTGSGLQVMRIGVPGSPACLVQGTQDGGHYIVNVDDASRRYVAFEPNYDFPLPAVVGEMANQDLHAAGPADMVIIVPSSGKLTEQAERLAEAHRKYDGLRVLVVRADRIYNEFSSGTPDATAYRRLMKMLYGRAESDDDAPRYLLLFGDCAWDNRMISTAWKKKSPEDYLLCFESENSFSDTESYVMEDYFGLLDDGEGNKLTDDKTDVGIGRF
ncbi:MAG: hypothetical protein K2J96_02030, partial [Bacteroidaceae bacterium]|nr:hypothetical protein [Bacteroidaceae bacterium]